MANRDIGPKIILEGEKEYRKAIADINREQRVLTSEMKKVSAEFDGNANSIDALNKKNEVLKKQYEEQEKNIRTLQGALEKAAEVYGENSSQVQDWQIKLNNAEAQLARLDKELQVNEKYLDEAKNSTDGNATSIDEYGKKVKKAEANTEDFNKELDNVKSTAAGFGKVVGGAIAGIGTALVGVMESTKEFREDFAKLETNAQTAGASISDVSEELKNLDAITGETDSNIEALSNLMQAGFTGNNLAQAVDALSGAVIKFPDTLKIEGLADGLQETLATGQAIGPFSELLERLGYNLEDFNEGLAGANNEAEKQQYILTVLSRTGLADVNRSYRENNKELIENADAQYELREVMSDIARAAAPAMNKAMGTLADGLADISEDFLPVITDGFDWMIDNSGTIISAVGGIATGMAVFKAGSAVQSGLELVNKSWVTYKTVTEGATVAQYALNLAQSMSPVGMLAIAIGAVTGGLLLYNSAMNDSEDRTKLFAEQLEKTAKANEEFNQSIADGIQTRKDNAESIDNEFGAIRKLSDELFALSEKENLSNEEKEVMVALVKELNDAMPELNLSIDKETGLLNKQQSEVDGLIESNIKLQKVKAAQEDMTRIAKEQYEVEKELAKQQKQRTGLAEGLAKKEALYNELLSDRSKMNSVVEERKRLEEVAKLGIEIDNLNLALDDNNKRVSDTQSSYKLLGEEWSQALKYIGENSEVEETTTAIKKFGDTAKESAIQVTEANKAQVESLEELAKEYTEGLGEMERDIRGQMKLFDEFDDSIEMSSQEMIRNLESQVEGVRNWSTNIQELSKKGIEEGLLQELYDMGPEAAGYIQTLNNMSEEELEKFNQLWVDMGKEVNKAAIGAMEVTRRDTVEEIKKLKNELYQQGAYAAQGFAEGFRSGQYEINTAVEAAMYGAINKGNMVLEIKSPSKVFERMAEFSVEGYSGRFKKKMAEFTKEMDKTMPTSLDVDISNNVGKSLNAVNGGNDVIAYPRGIKIEVPVNLDGREVARLTAKPMSEILEEMRSGNEVFS